MKANNDTFDQLVSIPDEIRIIPYNLSPKLMKEYHTYVQSLSNVSFDAQLLKEDWSAISDEETFKRLVVMTSLQSRLKPIDF